MIYPIKCQKLKVTSQYGYRTDPITGKKNKFHHGIDLNSSPYNGSAEIIAVEDGVVTKVSKIGKNMGTPCYVRIKHSNGLYTLYYHLKSNTINVSKGNKVKKGEILGIIGKTGKATGVHLHFQIDKGKDSSSIDPNPYLFDGKELIDDYTKGIYKCKYNMYIRKKPFGSIVKVKECTTEMKKALTSKNPEAEAIIKKGTKFTALGIEKKNNTSWAKNYSGYIAIDDGNVKYCVKC